MSRLLTYHNSGDTAPGTSTFAPVNDTAVRYEGADSRSYGSIEGQYDQWTVATTLKRAYFLRFYFRFTGTPTGLLRVLTVVNTAGTAAGTLRLSTAKKLRLFNTAGTGLGSESAALEEGVWHRVEIKITQAEAGNSKLSLLVNGVTLANEVEGNITNVALNRWRLGNTTAGAITTTLHVDTIALNDDQGAENNTFPGAITQATGGAATISGGGSITASGRKGGIAVASVTGGGGLVSSGRKDATGTSSASGGGSFTASGAKGALGTTILSGGGSTSATGSAEIEEEMESGTAQLSGGGSITASGRKGGIGSATASGGGSVQAAGISGRAGSSAASGGGVTTSSGSGIRVGVTQASGGGDSSANGSSARSGTTLLSGGGSLVGEGIKRSLGAPRFARGSLGRAEDNFAKSSR